MLDFGWQEFVMIGLVLVLVVGPKDMPRVMRSVAKYVSKARAMARDFQTSMMDVANQEEFRDVKRALDDVKTISAPAYVDPLKQFKESVEEGASELKQELKAIEEEKSAVNKTVAKKPTPKKKVTSKKAVKKKKATKAKKKGQKA